MVIAVNQSNGQQIQIARFKKKKPNKVKIRHYILYDNMQTVIYTVPMPLHTFTNKYYTQTKTELTETYSLH